MTKSMPLRQDLVPKDKGGTSSLKKEKTPQKKDLRVDMLWIIKFNVTDHVM